MAETIIVGIIICLAALYTGYRLFTKRSCGCACGCDAVAPKSGVKNAGGCCGSAQGGGCGNTSGACLCGK